MPDSLLFTNSIQKCLKIKRWTYFSEKKINYHLFRLTSSCETWNSLKSKRFLSNKKRITYPFISDQSDQTMHHLFVVDKEVHEPPSISPAIIAKPGVSCTT